MRIAITEWIDAIDPSMLSGSIAELGTSAGQITWQNSCDAVADFNPLPDADALQEFRDWIKPCGAWDDDEIAAMSDDHLRALCLQWIASDWREAFEWPEHDDGIDWQFYETMASDGNCPSSFYRDDAGIIYWNMTH